MNAPSRHVLGALVLLGMAGSLGACDRTTAPTVANAEPATPPADTPDAAVGTGASFAAGAPFAWRLRAQSPSAEPREWFPEVAHGRVPKQVEPWSCDYSLEDVNTDGDLAEQFGVLACASQRSGMRAAALVMCMTSPERPSECGAGNVQVMDAEGKDHSLSLSCATAQSDCFTRPGVETRGHGGALSAGAQGGAGTDVTGIDHSVTQTPPRAKWSVGMFREGFGDRRVILEDRAGELPSVTDAWRCSYVVQPGATPDGVKGEVGKIWCEAKTGERIGTSTVCIESADASGFANAAALRLSGPETPDVALMVDCKSEPR